MVWVSITGRELPRMGQEHEDARRLMQFVLEMASIVGDFGDRAVFGEGDHDEGAGAPGDFPRELSRAVAENSVFHQDAPFVFAKRLAEQCQAFAGDKTAVWESMGSAIVNYRRDLRAWFRREALEQYATVKHLVLETMLREAILCQFDCEAGSWLLPLILWDYPTLAAFCMATPKTKRIGGEGRFRLDQGQLHRMITGESSISLKKVIELLKSFKVDRGDPNCPSPLSYELLVFPKDTAIAACRTLHSAPAMLPHVAGSQKLQQFRESKYRELASDPSHPVPKPPRRESPLVRGPECYQTNYLLQVLDRPISREPVGSWGSYRLHSVLIGRDYRLVPRLVWTPPAPLALIPRQFPNWMRQNILGVNRTTATIAGGAA